ncbi:MULTISPECIES: hypothetical protein [Rickettsieae]|nr:hypothetical protein [Rickettsia endosymbiont of Culicoides newsteadi]
MRKVSNRQGLSNDVTNFSSINYILIFNNCGLITSSLIDTSLL